MKGLMLGKDNVVGPWVCERTGSYWTPGGGTTIGLFDEKQGLLAGVLYENWSGPNIFAHIAAVEGKRWLTREFLWAMFHYPFVELGCKRITGLVAASNIRARQFDEALGFKIEAVLREAHEDGDLLVYCMWRQDCRWLHIKRDKRNGNREEEASADAGPWRSSTSYERRELAKRPAHHGGEPLHPAGAGWVRRVGPASGG